MRMMEDLAAPFFQHKAANTMDEKAHRKVGPPCKPSRPRSLRHALGLV